MEDKTVETVEAPPCDEAMEELTEGRGERHDGVEPEQG